MMMARALGFSLAFLMWNLVLCVVFLWALLLPQRAFLAIVHFYLNGIAVIERVILGLRPKILGLDHLPTTPCIIAAKHQSAWETMKLPLLGRHPAIVLKKELMYLPLWGWYGAKYGMVPVDRGAGSKALKKMVAAARPFIAAGRDILIFPQGTRVPPGVHKNYKIGVAALYTELNVPVVPVALNSGLFWPKQGWRKKSGVVTIAFLPPIPTGLSRAAFMQRLEQDIETATAQLEQAAQTDAA